MYKYVKSGVEPQGESFTFDRGGNSSTSIINFVEPQIESSDSFDGVYWFGYKFNENVPSSTRARFIRFIKQLDSSTISKEDLDRFLRRPINALNQKLHCTYNVDCIVYPRSGRSPLVSQMISALHRVMGHSRVGVSYELVKAMPTDISFNWEDLEEDYGDDEYRLSQMRDYVETQLLPKIRRLEYFSLAQNVKPKYRKYIKNFLKFEDIDIAEKYEALVSATDVMVVDDINTSGATIDEILRQIRDVNSICNVYVYTLIRS